MTARGHPRGSSSSSSSSSSSISSSSAHDEASREQLDTNRAKQQSSGGSVAADVAAVANVHGAFVGQRRAGRQRKEGKRQGRDGMPREGEEVKMTLWREGGHPILPILPKVTLFVSVFLLFSGEMARFQVGNSRACKELF